MSEFAQGKYLVIKPTRFMTEGEIASNLNVDELSIQYVDPTINEECSDFYDDLSGAYTAKLNDSIEWDDLQVFLIFEDIKSTLFILKETEIFLGAIELTIENSRKMRELRLIMDKFQFYGSPKNDTDKHELEVAKSEISTLINNSW